MGRTKNPLARLNTNDRLYKPASNIERQPDDGCMKKIRIERSLKLRKEEIRQRDYDPIANTKVNENDWLDSFSTSNQRETVMPVFEKTI